MLPACTWSKNVGLYGIATRCCTRAVCNVEASTMLSTSSKQEEDQKAGAEDSGSCAAVGVGRAAAVRAGADAPAIRMPLAMGIAPLRVCPAGSRIRVQASQSRVRASCGQRGRPIAGRPREKARSGLRQSTDARAATGAGRCVPGSAGQRRTIDLD